MRDFTVTRYLLLHGVQLECQFELQEQESYQHGRKEQWSELISAKLLDSNVELLDLLHDDVISSLEAKSDQDDFYPDDWGDFIS